jgi:cysteinyl-tRNA synthetase
LKNDNSESHYKSHWIKQIPADIQSLAEQRRQAKTEKNWAEADRLRKELEEKGWEMKDGKEGYEVVKKS